MRFILNKAQEVYTPKQSWSKCGPTHLQPIIVWDPRHPTRWSYKLSELCAIFLVDIFRLWLVPAFSLFLLPAWGSCGHSDILDTIVSMVWQPRERHECLFRMSPLLPGQQAKWAKFLWQGVPPGEQAQFIGRRHKSEGWRGLKQKEFNALVLWCTELGFSYFIHISLWAHSCSEGFSTDAVSTAFSSTFNVTCHGSHQHMSLLPPLFLPALPYKPVLNWKSKWNDFCKVMDI